MAIEMPKLSVENGRVFIKLGDQVVEVFVEEVQVSDVWGGAEVRVSLKGALPSYNKQSGGLYVTDDSFAVHPSWAQESGPSFTLPEDDSPPAKASQWGSSLEGPHPSKCPEGNCLQQIDYYHGLITHLNDDHQWTFDQIADYLEDNGYDIVVREGGEA